MQHGGLPHPGSSRFPENRENNREFVVFSTIWAIVDAKSRNNSKVLACDSLVDRIREFSPHEQGMNHRNKEFRLFVLQNRSHCVCLADLSETDYMIYPITIVRFFQERRCTISSERALAHVSLLVVTGSPAFAGDDNIENETSQTGRRRALSAPPDEREHRALWVLGLDDPAATRHFHRAVDDRAAARL
jgi:hypothetical protein